ncbi:DUF4384 domain-containing protein [Burkholderia perseverans]|uniref:DUF4384 domain-containing protein n=1 Tax=Burkholderia perseverans TaxID=2615214 RepID=UPI001FEE0DBB|nr:DUF4384 domain-containing protein [Burkholderia perseverans]
MRYPLAALTVAALASHAWAGEGYTAKSLFFAQDDSLVTVSTAGAKEASPLVASRDTTATHAPSQDAGRIVKAAHKRKATALGASYFVRLKNADGTTQDVLAKRIFRSGDRFQLGVKVNRPSYVYILNQAPDGKVTQIYPQPSQDNFVDAMGVVFLPAKGAFQFDDQPGMEKLLVFVTSQREHDDVSRRLDHLAPDLISTAPAQKSADAGACPAASNLTAATPAAASAPDGGEPLRLTDQPASAPAGGEPLQLADAGTGYVSKGIAFAPDQDASCAASLAQDPSPGYKAKGIVFTDDAAPAAGGQVASYVVKPTTRADADLYLKINLLHE